MRDEARADLCSGVGSDALCAKLSDSVRGAMARVPRHLFVPVEHRMRAYLDEALPIGMRRYCPRPSTVALLLDACEIGAEDGVLLFGDGSGYAAAVAASLGAAVTLIEPVSELAQNAEEALRSVGGSERVAVKDRLPADSPAGGGLGAVVVAGSLHRAPRHLGARLRPGGRLVAPVGVGPAARLSVFERTARGLLRRELGPIDVLALPASLVLALGSE